MQTRPFFIICSSFFPYQTSSDHILKLHSQDYFRSHRWASTSWTDHGPPPASPLHYDLHRVLVPDRVPWDPWCRTKHVGGQLHLPNIGRVDFGIVILILHLEDSRGGSRRLLDWHFIATDLRKVEQVTRFGNSGDTMTFQSGDIGLYHPLPTCLRITRGPPGFPSLDKSPWDRFHLNRAVPWSDSPWCDQQPLISKTFMFFCG